MDNTTTTGFTGVTPEKLAIMKLNIHEHDKDFFSEPGTPTGARRRFDFNGSVNGDASSRSIIRAGRTTSRASRRSSSFMSSHRSKMSQELTSKAEGKFFALMDLMASASREASSLKEFWGQILSEREAFAREREELMEQITEITQEFELRESEQHKHSDDAGERKKQVEKLLLELSIAIGNVQGEKKKVAERENELDLTRRELIEIRETTATSRTGYEKLRSEIENMKILLTTAGADRDSARDEVERHIRDHHRVTRERTELSTKLTDVTSKLELSRKEVLTLTDRVKMHDMEQEERILEIERLREDARKARLRADEAGKEVLEHTEKHERLNREVTKLKEALRVIDAEKDEHVHVIDHLRRELKTMTIGRDEAEEKISDITLKYEHIKREVLSLKERQRDLELERTEITDTLERSRETHRVVVIERDEMRDEIDAANRKAEDARRQVITLTESLRRSEQSLVDVRSELFSATERTKYVDTERDDLRSKNSRLVTEIAELKESIVVFQAEIRTVSEIRDRLRGDLERTRQEFEEVTETITTFKDDSIELEFEIESLRTLLREAREQKESAIGARNTADRERDEAISRYEEKCREMERFEESAAAHYHASSRSEGMSRSTTSRMVSKTSTTGTSGTIIKHDGTD